MALHIQVLASGSKGNSILIASGKTRLLVDAGLSGRELERRLDKSPVTASRLDGILISHEHIDHVRGLGVMSRRHRLPVYLNRGTLDGLPSTVGEIGKPRIFTTGTSFKINDLTIHPFTVPHDAAECVGFVIESGQSRVGICTDLGYPTHLVRERLKECDCLVLEFNHDPQMLLDGPYPYPVKQRIKSRHGHLSNREAAELLAELHHERLRAVAMAHMSQTNNRPDLVHAELERLLEQAEYWREVQFELCGQDQAGSPFEVE